MSSVLVLAVGLLIYINRDHFRRPTIQISSTVRTGLTARRRRPANANAPADVAPVPTFRLSANYHLTSVKVVRLDELKAKGYAHPLWELVSDTDSDPVEIFYYGKPIGRMHPPSQDDVAEPLTTNVTYRLLVAAGKLKGQHDFTITNWDAP